MKTATGQPAAGLTASAVMTAPVVTVRSIDPVANVWKLMQGQHLDHVVAFEDQRCLGIVDVHDLWVSWAIDLEGPVRRSVAHLVTAAPCISPDTPMPMLCQGLLGSRNGAVLVIDDNGALQGIVTTSDVLRAVAQERDLPC